MDEHGQRRGATPDAGTGTRPCRCGELVVDHTGRVRIAILAISLLLLAPLALTTLRSTDPTASVDAVHQVAATAVIAPEEQDYLNRMNALRAAHGLQLLSLDDNMEALARAQTHAMVVEQHLYHTPDLVAGVTPGWRELGENVGFGSNTAVTWDAFIHSPPHLANLLKPEFSRVGIAVEADGNGIEWTTHRFLQPAMQAPPTVPPTTAPPPTEPPPTAGPTTAIPRPTVTRAPTTIRAIPVVPPTTVAPTTTSTTSATSTTSTPPATSGTVPAEVPPGTAVGLGAAGLPPDAAQSVTFETIASQRVVRAGLLAALLILTAAMADLIFQRYPWLLVRDHHHLVH